MTETTTQIATEPAASAGPVEPLLSDHDHAWRKSRVQSTWRELVGEYHCDLCSATWSL